MDLKIKAMTLLAKHLKTLVRNLSVNSWVGVANGDHILIVDANLYRVDLNTEKVSKV
jgi:hypothetical protein